jgi:hypothetical protein
LLLLQLVVLHPLIDDFEVLIQILVSSARRTEILFVVIFENLALELVGSEIRHVAQVPQIMSVLCFIDGERPCMEVDTLVVVCAGQLKSVARDHLSLKLEFGRIKRYKELLLAIGLEEGPTPSQGT